MDGAPEDEKQSASAAPEAAAAPEASAEASAVPEAGDGAPTKAATLTPLPTGWTSHVDGQTGATYYWNAGSGATSWDRPGADGTVGPGGGGASSASNPSHAAFVEKKRKIDATPQSEYMKMLLSGGAAEGGRAKATGNTTWVKHSDPTSGVPFFFNTKTQETTWDPPACGFIDASVSATAPAVAEADPNDAYAATATFNKATGRFEFADGLNYWDAVGRPQDRDGRMMSHYFDINTLEANRAEAEVKKKKLKKYDWRKYAAMKKDEKRKRKVQQLLMD